MSYFVNIDNQQKFKINGQVMKGVVKRSLKILKVKSPAEVSVVVTTSKTIHQLNLKYRKKNKVTSVLSFVFNEEEKFIMPSGSAPLLGEIIICYPEAKKLAEQEEITLEEKLKELLIHGLLHLLGFTHENKKQEKLMETKATKIKKTIG